jgi:hypothetical protein
MLLCGIYAQLDERRKETCVCAENIYIPLNSTRAFFTLNETLFALLPPRYTEKCGDWNF